MGIPRAIAPTVRDVLSGRSARWPALDDGLAMRSVATLDAHGVLAHLHAARRAGRLDGLPAAVADAAGSAYMATAAKSAIWMRERARVAAALSAAGAVPVAVKGAALLGTVYGNPALRPMVDLDILVENASMDAATTALTELGYRQGLTEAEAYAHHRAFAREGPGGIEVAVELHRRLLASPPYDLRFPTDRVVRRSVAGPDPGLRQIAPVDLLLHLAGHLVLQHPGGERLIWVADIDGAVRRWFAGPADWADVAECARQTWLARALADALALAAFWCDTPVPPAVRSALEQSPGRGELAAYHRLRHRAPIGQEGARLWADVRGIAGWRGKAAFAWAHLFPSPAYIRQWYGLDRARGLPIIYVRRVLRGVGHIVTGRRRPDLTRPSEAPEEWMIDHDA